MNNGYFQELDYSKFVLIINNEDKYSYNMKCKKKMIFMMQKYYVYQSYWLDPKKVVRTFYLSARELRRA